MARNLLNVRIKLERIHCYEESDWGSAEPYFWTVFFKIDGETLTINTGATLSGSPVVVGTSGSHGNLGTRDVEAGDDIPIPEALGVWQTILRPIPVPASLKGVLGDDKAGVVGVACVLLEEDNVTAHGALAGREALNRGVKTAIEQIVAELGPSKPDVTDQDITKRIPDIEKAVRQAIEQRQNFFEDLWTLIDPDDTIGNVVFRFGHDELASQTRIPINKRWTQSGDDWELLGFVEVTSVQLLTVVHPLPVVGGSSTEWSKDQQDRIVIVVRFNKAVNTSTVVVQKTLILDFENDHNAQATLNWSPDRKELTITTTKTSSQLFGTFNSFFKLTLFGTNVGNGAIQADDGTALDGEADSKAGGNYEITFLGQIA